MRPEVEDRLRELAVSEPPAEQGSTDDLIAAFMKGAQDTATRALARQIFAEHQEFFDLIGDR
jgi:hypothetical protein